MKLQEHPDYHEGFFDACDCEPLFEGECSAEYKAGWRAFWSVYCRMNDFDFLESPLAALLPGDSAAHRYNN